MKVETQRALDRWFGVPLLWLLSGLARCMPRRPVPQPRAIVVILLSEMGSLVCAQPMILELQQRYPSARIHLLMFARNRGVMDLLALVPDDCVVTIDDRGLGRFLRSTLTALRTLRAARVDVAIDCELFARASAILSYFSGAALRVGFYRFNQEGLDRGSVVNRPVPYNPYAHISAQFLALARSIESATWPAAKGLELPARAEVRPLAVDPRAVGAATQRLESEFPAIVGRRLVMLYAGAGILPIRGWPIERFGAVAHALCTDGYAVAVIGLPEDRSLGEQIVAAAATATCINLAGYTRSLTELVTLFHRAALLISNDGGPGHFAALTPLPVVSLFGPETPLLYAPLARRARALHRPMPCSPCLTAYNHRNTACDGDNVCLKQISVAEVLQAAGELLAEPA